MYTYTFVIFLVLFRSYLQHVHRSHDPLRRSTEEGRPDTVVEIGLDPCTVPRVACAQSLFPPGVDKTTSWVSFRGVLLHHRYPPFVEMLSVFLPIRISLKAARLATILRSLCRDRFGVRYPPCLGALRAVCRVSRAHVCTCLLYTSPSPRD